MTDFERSMMNPVACMGTAARLPGSPRPRVSRFSLSADAGFTLVEAVIVIAITGIVAAVVAVFIRLPVQGYVDTVARAELTDIADLALRRMARDIRLALPNSVRVRTAANGDLYLELLLTTTGGRYLAEEDGQGGDILEFDQTVNCATTPAHCSFEIVGTPPAGDQRIVENDLIVVYNLGSGFDPADAYAGGNRATVAATPAGKVVTLTSNPFAAQSPPMRSPSGRFQVVRTPVTYHCRQGAGGTGALTRYWGYAIQAAQPADIAAVPLAAPTPHALLATGVVNCAFQYASMANVHSALVGLGLTLQMPNTNSGTVALFHQVHVDNTP